MNYKEKYTPEEWEIVSYLPLAITQLMGGAGSKGKIASTSEMASGLQMISNGLKRYSKNELINAIAPDKEDFANHANTIKSYLDVLIIFWEQNDIETTEDFLKMTLDHCDQVVVILKNKELDQVISEYKNWLLEIAFVVANDSAEGSFFSFNREVFSKEERRIYDKLKTVLQ